MPKGSPRPEAERFWAKVDMSGECWLWLASRAKYGYGQFHVGIAPVLAHRWAWEALAGPIPEGLTVDHLCVNPPCVNPGHMELVTLAENSRRVWTRKRAA